MHWGDNHSELCVSPEMHCAWCKARYVKLWYGWLFGVDKVKGGSALLQLTATAVRQSMSLSDPKVNLRGAKIELFRSADATGSAVSARVTLHPSPERLPGEEPDVLAHLMRFYRIPFYPDGRHEIDEGVQP